MVYGIFSGAYSDWDAHGYFDTLEEAEKYAREKGTDYYVLPLLNLAEGADQDVRRAYHFYLSFGGYYERAEDDDDFLRKPRSRVATYGNGHLAYVIVYVRPGDEYKIPKIAHDLIAKWKAEREGIM